MRSCAIAFVVLALATPAQAQSSGPPTYAVGDTWTFSHGATHKVERSDGEGLVISGINRNCPACLYHFSPTLALMKITDAQGNPADSASLGFAPLGKDWKFYDFPLESGKSWRISAQGLFRRSMNRYTVDLKVLAYEDVKTKAGTFKAYRISRDWTIEGFYSSPGGRWNDNIWFSPEVKWVVKFTTTSQTAPEYELTSYGLK